MLLLRSLLFATAVVTSSQTMKLVHYRGGIVDFAIPAAWVEEYSSNGGGTFYLDENDSGTLRLSVQTFEKTTPGSLPSSADLLVTKKPIAGESVRTLENGNAIRQYVVRSEEDGEAITLYWWHLANTAQPSTLRIASFSYTVLTSQESSAELARDLEMLQLSIESASFGAGSPG
jgi:hypothetical protein